MSSIQLFPNYRNVEFRPVEFDGDPSAAWRTVQERSGQLLTDKGVELLRQGLDDHVNWILVESPYVCEDFRDLYQNFYSRKFRRRNAAHCVRLHFFAKRFPIEEVLYSGDVNPSLDDPIQQNYLGFSVIEPMARQCIGRTVIDPFALSHNPAESHLLRTSFKIRLAGRSFRAFGFPYRSQNAESTVCAHVTLWGVCRFFSTKLDRYPKWLPFDLVRMAGRRNGRVYPYHGMNYADYSEILDRFGCHPHIVLNHGFGWDPFAVPAASDQQVRDAPTTQTPVPGSTKTENLDHRPPERQCKENEGFADFRKNLYTYVESGFPVMATFGNHVVSLIGHHSMNPNDITSALEQKSPAELVHAAELVDRYIVVDDNQFPYQPLAVHLPESREFQYRSVRQIRALVVPLGDDTFLRPIDVELFLKAFVQTSDGDQLLTQTIDLAQAQLSLTDLHDEPIIYRPFLTTGASLKRFWHRQNTNEPEDLAFFPGLNRALPQFVWCVELSTSSLRHPNQDRAIGFLVFDATAGATDLEPIYVRIGPAIALHRKAVSTDTTTADDLEISPESSGLAWELPSDYSTFKQFRHNLGNPADAQPRSNQA